MSVLTRKKFSELRELKITCKGEGWQIKNSACNCIIAVGAYDIRIRKSGVDKITKYGVICPSCGCFTSIPRKKLPDSFVIKAKVL